MLFDKFITGARLTNGNIVLHVDLFNLHSYY